MSEKYAEANQCAELLRLRRGYSVAQLPRRQLGLCAEAQDQPLFSD